MMTRKHIFDFIMKQKTAMVASVDEEGFPNVKAMFAPKKIEGNCFYFSTNTSSVRTTQFLNNPNASIYFYHRGLFRYEGIMLIGSMEVLQDDDIRKEIWSKGDIIYYKEGVTDPDYCVFKFTAVKGRYYCDLKNESFNIEDLL